MNHYDTAWKRLYDLPVMVEHLFVGYFAPMAGLLDFGGLAMLSPESVDHDHRRKEGDMVWRAPYADGSGRSLALLVEFQTASDKNMAARMLRYRAAVVERLVDQKELDADGVARTLSVVVHTGGGRWTSIGSAPPEDVEVDAGDEVRLPPHMPYALVRVQGIWDWRVTPSPGRHDTRSGSCRRAPRAASCSCRSTGTP